MRLSKCFCIGLYFFLQSTLILSFRVAKWQDNAVLYQIYPRSFMDSNGDGIGDLKGITSRMDHLKDIGVTVLWLSPIYKSPQKDYGYDISDFKDVTPEYGTLQDFDELVAKARKLGLKILMDLVPNHSSDEHDWFQKSIKNIKPFDDFYIWKNAVYDQSGNRRPPNNWLSNFGGSAWTWNSQRGQYYYHAFHAGQPDLNYRNPNVRKEMEDVIKFWLNRGVDGFRVDAIKHLFEDSQFHDEPPSGANVPTSDYAYLQHIYTEGQNENFDIVKSWVNLGSDSNLMMMEDYSSISKLMNYYTIGTDPFNFMFVGDLNNRSSPMNFKSRIDEWINSMPKDKQANWVTGNHDNPRVASRFGWDNNRADQLSILGAVLPGILVVYNGDEIGMTDRYFTYEETVDPPGCQAGPDRYQLKSRDPARTPFQWDSSTSAGFSTSKTTWLPVNDNYKTLNLAAEKLAKVSHVKVFKALTKLKKQEIMHTAKLEVVAGDKVLAVIRRPIGQDPVVLLVNFSYESMIVDAKTWLNVPELMAIYISSVKSNLVNGRIVNMGHLHLPGAASVVLANYKFVNQLLDE